jgi:hypothetical protein
MEPPVSEWSFVTAAYGLSWIVLGVLALNAHRALSRAQRELRQQEEA